MRIWITGIGGFLGSHLAETLSALGHDVAGNDSFICGSGENIPDGMYYSQTDCRDFDAVKRKLDRFKPDVLVHTAATAAEGFSVFSPHFITSNIAEASVATFSAAIASGVKRIVYMSSMSRYGKGKSGHDGYMQMRPDGPPFTEDEHVTAPVDPYAFAKVYSEGVLKSLCDTHSVKWSICVPHNIIGTRQEITPYRNVVSIFLNRLKLGLPVYIYGDGEQKRSFSPVKDCLHSLVQIVEGKADGEVVNIGPDDNEITINQLLRICEEVTGIKANVQYLPPRPVTDTVKEAYCSSDKARRLLGFKPQQDIVECIREMSDQMVPKPFDYSFPLEIDSPLCPVTWRDKL
jgi:UDP-glucose 4-epimerase